MSQQLERLHELVWSKATKVGRSAPKITDELLKILCPKTTAAAKEEGVTGWLRAGLNREVKRILKAANDDHAQQDLALINPAFHSKVRELRHSAYYVEARAEHVPVYDLINDVELLDQARAYMRQKGVECLEEARRLDALARVVKAKAA